LIKSQLLYQLSYEATKEGAEVRDARRLVNPDFRALEPWLSRA